MGPKEGTTVHTKQMSSKLPPSGALPVHVLNCRGRTFISEQRCLTDGAKSKMESWVCLIPSFDWALSMIFQEYLEAMGHHHRRTANFWVTRMDLTNNGKYWTLNLNICFIYQFKICFNDNTSFLFPSLWNTPGGDFLVERKVRKGFCFLYFFFLEKIGQH